MSGRSEKREVKSEKKEIGTIYHNRTYFLRTELATATAPDGTEYTVCQNADGQPLVRSSKTGNYWGITYQELIGLAIENDVDEQFKPNN